MKAIQIVLLSFAGGALIGGGIMKVLVMKEPTRPAVDPAYLQSGGNASEDGQLEEIQELIARIDRKNEQIASLESQLDAMKATVSDEQIAMTEEQARAVMNEARRREMQARMEERFADQANKLADKYGLSDTQRRLLAEVYKAQFDHSQARRRGEVDGGFNFDGALEDILNEQQFNEYLADSQEQIYNRAEQIAAGSMERLTRAMGLNESQATAVYETMHLTAQEMMIAYQTGEDFNMREVMNERLAEILTPEQMAAMEQSIRRGISGGGGGRPGGGRGGGGPGR
jgi:hypothetical protein